MRSENVRDRLKRAAADMDVLAFRLFRQSETALSELTKLHNRSVETGQPIPTQSITNLLVRWSSELHANRKEIK